MTKLNGKIDTLVDALRSAEKYISKATDEKTIRQQIEARDALTSADVDPTRANAMTLMAGENISVAQLFNQKLKANDKEAQSQNYD